jgi:hypothetical protein
METRQYRGYKIVLMRQWASWCVDAYPTRADLPLLALSTLDTLAPGKDAAVAEVKRNIDRLLASIATRH